MEDEDSREVERERRDKVISCRSPDESVDEVGRVEEEGGGRGRKEEEVKEESGVRLSLLSS